MLQMVVMLRMATTTLTLTLFLTPKSILASNLDPEPNPGPNPGPYGVQVLALLSQELDMALPTTALFDYPTVEALGYYIAASRVRITPTLTVIAHPPLHPWRCSPAASSSQG